MLDLARRVISASGSPPGEESGSQPAAAVDNNTLSPIRGSSSKMHKVQPKKKHIFFLIFPFSCECGKMCGFSSFLNSGSRLSLASGLFLSCPNRREIMRGEIGGGGGGQGERNDNPQFLPHAWKVGEGQTVMGNGSRRSGGEEILAEIQPRKEASLQGCDRLSVSCSQIAVAHMQAADTVQIGH